MTKKLSWIASLAALATVSTALAAATAGANDDAGVRGALGHADRRRRGQRDGRDAREPRRRLADHEVRAALRVEPRNSSATGKELFTGCLDSNANGTCDKKEPAGTLKFTFMYWASFDPATGALLHGNCVHPVDGGSGSFKQGRGRDPHGGHARRAPTSSRPTRARSSTRRRSPAQASQPPDARVRERERRRSRRGLRRDPERRACSGAGGPGRPPAPCPAALGRRPGEYAWRRRARLPDSRVARGVDGDRVVALGGARCRAVLAVLVSARTGPSRSAA